MPGITHRLNLLKVGELSSLTERIVTLQDVQEFGRLTGDLEPIHVDPAHAGKSLYGTCIAHGVFVLGLMADKLLSEERIGPNVSYGYDRVRFVRPVLVGSRIFTQGRIIEIRRDRHEVVVEETCKDSAGTMLAVAHHIYRLLE
jgi:acyl dehydratase